MRPSYGAWPSRQAPITAPAAWFFGSLAQAAELAP
jgi:hypothetical protein